jgi:hypothetical protein
MLISFPDPNLSLGYANWLVVLKAVSHFLGPFFNTLSNRLAQVDVFYLQVSLTAPKLCAKKFEGPHHFLGGRFVPPAIANKYSLQLPPYPGTSMCVRIGKPNQPVDVAALRVNYVGFELLEEQAHGDPIQQFKEWFDEAVRQDLPEPNAMTLATANQDGRPSARMVLLKGFDEHGFVWYTNYDSEKASDLLSNPKASLVFFWERLHRQVLCPAYIKK